MGHATRREVSLGYGWLLRGTYGLMAMAAVIPGLRYGEPVVVRAMWPPGGGAGVGCRLAVSIQRRSAGVAGEQSRRGHTARVTAMTGIERQRDAVDADTPEFPPALDLVAPMIGVIGLVAAGARRR